MASFVPAIVTAVGQVKQGEAAKQAAYFNATMKDDAATATQQQSGLDESTQRREAQMMLGDQAAAMGEAGIAGSPSSEAVQRQSSINAEMDALKIRYKANLSAWGFRSQGILDRMEGDSAQQQANLLAAGTLLTAAAKKYY